MFLVDFIAPRCPVTDSRRIHLVPESWEKFVGKSSYSSLVYQSGGEIQEDDPVNGKYVTLVKEAFAALTKHSPRKLDFEIVVVENGTNNAWCLPGGKMAINLGIIKNMEKDANTYGLLLPPSLKQRVSAVISHEITHATARHYGRSLEISILVVAVLFIASYIWKSYIYSSYSRSIEEAKKQGDYKKVHQLEQSRDLLVSSNIITKLASKVISAGAGLANSRAHELEADKFGMHLLHKAERAGSIDKGSVEAAVWLQHFFKSKHPEKRSWLMNMISTHPSSQERIDANKRTLTELRNK